MSNIQVIEQKLVKLYNDELLAVKAGDNQVYVSINQMCEALGIAAPMQRRRIREHEILSEGYALGSVLTEGGNQQAALLRVDLVPLWLIGIQINSVREDVRPKLKLFVQRAANVLAEAFQEGRLTADPGFEDLLKQASSDVVEAYQIAQAIMRLARNQIMLETRLEDHGRTLEDYGRRLETIEADMHQEDRYISESQATQISQAVKAIAITMGKQTGRNEFGATWGEFYRKFGISKYRYLPISKFEDALAWLNEFYHGLTGETPF